MEFGSWFLVLGSWFLVLGIWVVGEMPAIELLEATHRFPGKFMFKVIGRADQGFAARVVAAVSIRAAVGRARSSRMGVARVGVGRPQGQAVDPAGAGGAMG